MFPEIPILIQQRRFEQFRRHGVQRGEYPVFFIVRQTYAQNAARPVRKHARKIRPAVEIRTGSQQQGQQSRADRVSNIPEKAAATSRRGARDGSFP